MALVRHITIEDVEGARRDFVLRLPDDATIGEVLELLDVELDRVAIDGRLVPASATIDEARLWDGAVLRLRPASGGSGHDAADGSVVALDQIAGLTSGGSLGLAPGRYGFGPAAIAGSALDVGELHRSSFELDVAPDGTTTLTPAGESIGLDGLEVVGATTVGGAVIDAGTARFTLSEPTPPVRRTLPDRSFHRAPRRDEAPPSVRLVPPELPNPPADPPGLSWITMLAPLAPALLLAAVVSPRFALFAVFGPVLMGARWLEGRRTHRAETRRHDELAESAVARFTNELVALRRELAAHRRTLDPSPAEVLRRARRLDARLWERRPEHDDFATVAVGYGTAPWTPDLGTTARVPGRLREVVDRLDGLPSVPIRADLREGPLGIVGDRTAALAVARAVLASSATQSSPDDLPFTLVTATARLGDWEWTKWLPHLGRPARVATDGYAADHLAGQIAVAAPDSHTARHPPSTPLPLVLVDGVDELHRRGSLLRRAIADGVVSAVIVARSSDELPASCRWILDLGADDSATASLHDLAGRTRTDVTPIGMPTELATDVARSIAWLVDPDATASDRGLPERLHLPELLDGIDADDVQRRWLAGGPDPAPTVPIGVADSGPLVIDLAIDGPHALLAGTTGAGKSEFLRSVVVGLAATHSTETLGVVLIDYKGGGAFDACADLPHTVAVVTDLDEHLGERALRSLQAELRHRERRFRDAGASDLHVFRATGAVMPRLVVVVDEFATLAAELPEFLDALVDIAQRGRSLGIHLVLATQRPAGVLDAKIRANTNLRISLRVQDENDALDVVGVTAPAHLGRREVGRGVARLAASEVIAFQSAWSGGRTATTDHTRIEPFTLLGSAGAAHDPLDRADPATPVDLDRMVAAVCDAHRLAGLAAPRRPWLPALPSTLPMTADAAAAAPPPGDDAEPDPGAVIGVCDLPHEQRHGVVRVDPALGHVLVYGIDAATTATTLATIGVRLAAAATADELHLHVVDDAAGRLAPLRALPHTGAVVSTDDHDLVRRLVGLLDRRLDERRTTAAAHPRIVVLVAGLGSWFERVTDSGRTDDLAPLQRLLRDGPALGVTVVGSARHDRAIPVRLLHQIQQTFVHRLADPAGLATFGLRPRETPALADHQVIEVATGAIGTMHSIPDLADAVATLAARTPAPVCPPDHIQTLGSTVTLGDLDIGPRRDGRRVLCPIGLSPDDVSTVELVIDPVAVVVGAPGTGRTRTLGLLLDRLAAAGVEPAHCLIVGAPDTPLLRLVRARFGDDVVRHVAHDAAPEALGHGPGRIVVVDDLDRVEATLGSAIEAIANDSASGTIVLASGRTEDLTSMLGWTRVFRSTRAAVLLQPRPGDADVFRAALPFRTPQVHPPGRAAVLVDGVVRMCQLADLGDL